MNKKLHYRPANRLHLDTWGQAKQVPFPVVPARWAWQEKKKIIKFEKEWAPCCPMAWVGVTRSASTYIGKRGPINELGRGFGQLDSHPVPCELHSKVPVHKSGRVSAPL